MPEATSTHREALLFLDSAAYRDGYAVGARMAVHGRTETLGAVDIPTRWLGGDLEKAWDGWTVAAHDYLDGINQAITDITAIRTPAATITNTGRRTPPATTSTDTAGNPRHETPWFDPTTGTPTANPFGDDFACCRHHQH